jgi:hypothetical protein
MGRLGRLFYSMFSMVFYGLFDTLLLSTFGYSMYSHSTVFSKFSFFALQLFYVQLVNLWLFDLKLFAIQFLHICLVDVQ